MMSKPPNVELLDFEPAAQKFVAAITKQQIHIQRLALLHRIIHIPLMFIHRLITEIHRFEAAQFLDAVQEFTALDPHPSRHHSLARLFLPTKIDDPDVHLWPAFNLGQKINQSAAVVIGAIQSFQFNCRVGITSMELIGLQALREILLPHLRERLFRIHHLRFLWRSFLFIVKLLPNRLNDRAKPLLHRNSHAHRSSFIVQYRLTRFSFGFLISLPIQNLLQAG